MIGSPLNVLSAPLEARFSTLFNEKLKSLLIFGEIVHYHMFYTNRNDILRAIRLRIGRV